MTTTKKHDNISRLRRIASVAGAETVASFTYTYNDANQRKAASLEDGSYWVYAYDALGQVTSGKKYWSDGTPVDGQQFEYAFDDIGNRKSAGSGGNAGDLHPSGYEVNSLNQYRSRSVPGYVNTLGEASTNARVTLWGDNGAYSVTKRKGEYFYGELPVNNSTGAVWLTLTNLGVVRSNGKDVVDAVSGGAFVAATPEVFGYDLDGNLTNDGRWVYTWDAENRLLSMVSGTTVGPQQLLKFEYDSKGRRVRKQVWDNTKGTGKPNRELRFVYDGWNLISELSSDLDPVNSFTWGVDLSGSLQGAGGVGGLLVVKSAEDDGQFVACDGSGNVAGLVRAANTSDRVLHEYGPFGELLRGTGSMASANPFRFSTKYQDDAMDLIYYGHRYYNFTLGRWINRDPVRETGFRRNAVAARSQILTGSRSIEEVNPMLANGNDLLMKIDYLGLLSCCPELVGSTPCEQICRMALSIYELNTNMIYGAVVCYHGKVCPCVGGDPENGWSPGDCPLIDDVIAFHEGQHANKTVCHACGVFLAGADDLPNVDFNQEECEQRTISRASLEYLLPYLDGRCREVAEGYIDNVTPWINANCSQQ